MSDWKESLEEEIKSLQDEIIDLEEKHKEELEEKDKYIAGLEEKLNDIKHIVT